MPLYNALPLYRAFLFSPMTYADKLKDPRWQRKRLEIMNRDNFKCQLCNDEKSSLQVHHEKYIGDPWEATDEDLITYCCSCHKVVETFKKEVPKYQILKVSKINTSKEYSTLAVMFIKNDCETVIAIYQHDLITDNAEILIGVNEVFVDILKNMFSNGKNNK